ncbi:MAG: hypothetical protein JRJ10_12100 [Deltaproteobacteria bacterium]|nr:hypothetical protein [Deltaproteobacteria bacterium]
MDYFESITALLREWLPVLITLLVGIVAISAVYRILMKRQTPNPHEASDSYVRE